MSVLEDVKLPNGCLSGKVAIVTGAAGALGRSIVAAFLEQGAEVVGVDITGDGLICDVGSQVGCQSMIEKTVELHGTVDILVLNAGFQIVHPIADFPEADWDRLLDIYLKGPFLAMKAAWPYLVSKPGSRILVTASTSSFQAEPYKAPYIAARHGILGLIKVAALEGAPFGLTANCVAPAWMDTPAVAKQLKKQSELRGISEAEVLEGFLSRQPVKRFVKTEEVASAFTFLASPAAAAITGALRTGRSGDIVVVIWHSENRAIGRILSDQATTSPDNRALTDAETGVSYSYRQLNDVVDRTAHALISLGVQSGDFVTLFSSNSTDYIIASYAIRKLGAVEVAINAQARGSQLLHMLSMAPGSIIMISVDQLEALVEIAGDLPSPEAIVFIDAVTGEALSTSETIFGRGPRPLIHSLSTLRESYPAREVTVDVDALSAAMVIFTSGTTGPSKGCLLTHRALVRSAGSVGAALDIQANDCMYAPFPLFHARASSLDLLPTFMAGGHVVVAKRFSLSRFWEDMVRFDVTLFSIIGSMMQLLWKQKSSEIERQHRVRLCWGGPITIEPSEFEARFGVEVLPGEGVFGMSETGMLCMSSFDRQTSGKVRRDLEVIIADEKGAALPHGEVGEILVRGKEPGVLFQGYVNMPEETVKACKNLWFHTGDLGTLDDQGRLLFTERKRDRIRVGGNNVSSWEVESVVDRHDQVVESVVVGVRNPLGEDDIALFVLRRRDSGISGEEIAEYCKLNLAAYMVPRFVIVVNSIPKTETGKPAKGKLQELFFQKKNEHAESIYERLR